MHIVKFKTLKDFFCKPDYRNSEKELRAWKTIVNSKKWKNPHEVKADFPSADHVGNNRIVFNICVNKFRLVVLFRYNIQRVFIRFIGTHKEYDTIKNIRNI